MMIFSLAAVAALSAPGAPACSPVTYAALTAPARANEKPFDLSCSVTLEKGDNIYRRLRLAGPSASRVLIDCNGGAIGYDGMVAELRRRGGAELSPFAVPTVKIVSLREGATWSPPVDIVIRRCTIYGATQIMGMEGSQLLSPSREKNFTSIAQKNAPGRITIADSALVSYWHVPLYIGAGANEVTLVHSEVKGVGDLGIYLDHESARNRIIGNTFTIRPKREMIAVDGSAYNVISGNRIQLSEHDGVYLYRNCGENGVVRHQTPSNNRVMDNTFVIPEGSKLQPVVVNSRSAAAKKQAYCHLDDGFPFGSSKDDNDNGVANTVENNRVITEAR
ncbi:NosD domain-containing protein [Massilia sp. METH4]|uniref:right-handed parallel beta-helix repeat-containing protein n=1 Tax=Massilia sp. METH4 TaxID=3123041 RepID=UPI0030D15BFC